MNLEYAGACRPARYVGGDYYDFIPRGDDRVGLALGDISGKGVSAALLMAGLQASLRINAEVHEAGVDQIMTETNRQVHAATDKSHFASLFYGVLSGRTRVLDYANAGHNPPLVLRGKTGGFEVIRLETTGPALGLVPDSAYTALSIQLLPGDLLIIYSDGVTEAMNQAEELLGEQRLIASASALLDLSVIEVRDRIIEEVIRFTGDRPLHDDITLIVARLT